MKPSLLIGLIVLPLLIVLSSSLYTVSEVEQVIITQFGNPVGEPVKEAGLHFKVPFVQMVNRFEKRVLEWDGPATKMPTKDKVYIVADTFGRWRITEPLLFLQQLRDERSAQSRLDDILGSETRTVIARHDFIEAVRTSKERKAVRDDTVSTTLDSRIGVLPTITRGRTELEHEILASAMPKVRGLGIELLDVRFKRLNYNDSVSATIYERMISEREQIADRYRSEGEGEAAKIGGTKERELLTISSGAYRKVQEVQGMADAQATEIYAKAYNKSPEAVELFRFLATLDAYKKAITPDTRLILTTDSDFLRLFKSETGEVPPAPALPGAPLIPGFQQMPSLLDTPSTVK